MNYSIGRVLAKDCVAKFIDIKPIVVPKLRRKEKSYEQKVCKNRSKSRENTPEKRL